MLHKIHIRKYICILIITLGEKLFAHPYILIWDCYFDERKLSKNNVLHDNEEGLINTCSL